MKLFSVLFALPMLAPLPANAQTRSEESVLMPPNPDIRARFEEGTFSSGVIANGMVYLTGVEAIPRPNETLEDTYTRVFNIIARELGQAGASWDDVVDVTSYHTDIDGQIGMLTNVNRRFMKPPFAAWTVAEVKRLFNPNAVTAIKVVARIP